MPIFIIYLSISPPGLLWMVALVNTSTSNSNTTGACASVSCSGSVRDGMSVPARASVPPPASGGGVGGGERRGGLSAPATGTTLVFRAHSALTHPAPLAHAAAKYVDIQKKKIDAFFLFR
jgi:hypothetical protein